MKKYYSLVSFILFLSLSLRAEIKKTVTFTESDETIIYEVENVEGSQLLTIKTCTDNQASKCRSLLVVPKWPEVNENTIETFEKYYTLKNAGEGLIYGAAAWFTLNFLLFPGIIVKQIRDLSYLSETWKAIISDRGARYQILAFLGAPTVVMGLAAFYKKNQLNSADRMSLELIFAVHNNTERDIISDITYKSYVAGIKMGKKALKKIDLL